MITYDLGLGQLSKELLASINILGDGYTSQYGNQELRKLVAEREQVGQENILVTTGASLALVTVLSLLERPASVLCPRPYYPGYVDILQAIDHKIIFYQLKENGDIDCEQIAGLVEEDTKCILLNFPGNPMGNVPDSSTIDSLVRICNHRKLFALLDVVYSPFAFNRQHWESLNLQDFHDYAQIHSLSKEFAIAGERIGFIVSSSSNIDKYCSRHFSLAMNAPAMGQILCERYFSEIASQQAQIREGLRQNMETALEIIGSIESINCFKPEGGFFLWIKSTRNISSSIVSEICAENGIRIMPGYHFGADKEYFRASFSISPELLVPAYERLANILNSLE